MSNINAFAALTLAIVNAQNTVESGRNQFPRELRTAFGTRKAEDLDKFCKGYVAEAREAIRADYNKAVIAEFESYSERERIELVRVDTLASPAFENVGTGELHKRLMVLKVRASEAKKILGLFLAGDFHAQEFYAGAIPASTVLAKAANVTTGNAEGGEGEGEEQSKSEMDAATKLAHMIATAIASAEKAGMSKADILATVAKVAQNVNAAK